MNIKSVTILVIIVLALCTFFIFANAYADGQNSEIKPDTEYEKYDFDLTFDEECVTLNGYAGQSINIIIPDSVNGKPITKISEGAFQGNRNIGSVELPHHLSLIGTKAFYDSSVSGVIVIPSSVKTIATYAFQSTDITGLVIQSDCSIATCAFSNLEDIEFVYISDGYSPILDSFGYLPSLEVAIIPGTVTEIRDGTFNNCGSLKIITQSGSFAEQYALANSIPCETNTYDEYVKRYEELYPREVEEDTHFFLDVDKLYEYQGVYKEDEYGLSYIVINEDSVIEFNFYNEDEGKATKSDYKVFMSEYNGEPCLLYQFYDDNESEATSWFILSENNGEKCIKHTSCFDRNNKYSYHSSIYKLDSDMSIIKLNNRYAKSISKTKPYVGMLNSQVLNSAWGEPNKVNKTTYSWGVSEQWVYGNGRYVYLENGIVTAVQE